MTFLHNNCSFQIENLQYTGNQSDFVNIGSFTGKIKPIGLQEKNFNLSEIKGDSYKITIKGDINAQINGKIIILDGVFTGEYTIKDIKKHVGIKLSTTKILIVKI